MKKGAASKPVLIGEYEITLADRVIHYILKRSYKAKLVWLRVKAPTGLTVTVPVNYRLKQVPVFLKTHSVWILRRLAELENKSQEPSGSHVHNNETILFLGQPLKIAALNNQQDTTSIKIDNGKLIINTSKSGKMPAYILLENWMKGKAVQLIMQKVEVFSKCLKVVFNRISIRDQKSRWGSCSHLKNLSFNWRLIMAPEPVIDYVVIHELCHLKEMNHSGSFWLLVSRFCPQWQEKRKWLNEYGKDLRSALTG